MVCVLLDLPAPHYGTCEFERYAVDIELFDVKIQHVDCRCDVHISEYFHLSKAWAVIELAQHDFRAGPLFRWPTVESSNSLSTRNNVTITNYKKNL